MQGKSDALNKLRNLEAEFDALQEQLEEAEDGKADVQKQLSRANTELQQWKSRYEQEAQGKVEELEDAK